MADLYKEIYHMRNSPYILQLAFTGRYIAYVNVFQLVDLL